MRMGCLCLLLFVQAHAEDVWTLQADEAIYKGQVAELCGHVSLAHPLGVLQAERALIPNQSLVEMSGHVRFDLQKRQGTLRCAEAILDGEQRTATCYGVTHPVVYEEALIAPLHIGGDWLVMAFDPMGIIHLLHMVDVQGEITGDHPLHFAAKVLDWNQNEHVLRLANQVLVDIEGKGKLTSEGPVILQTGESSIETVVCDSEAILEFTDPETSVDHLLTCPQGIAIDQLKGRAVAKGDELHQVLFEDPFGELFADQVIVEFISKDNCLEPQRVILEGNVRILNRFLKAGEEPGGHMQYALADRAIYTPKSKQITFFGKPPKRVLFYDKIRALQVSAPKLTVRRDQPSQKELFEGEGNVRFSFNQKEIQQMMELFSLPSMENANDKPLP